jgi:hypothetical protein
MKPWQFLIQKEGDRDWLTLKEPVVDIEAGKYRIIAQSNCANLDVEIRLIYQQNSQKFYRRSNSEGLIIIFPVMELQPGLWELHCYGDLMSELLGKCRQENLQLRVFSKSTSSDRKTQFPSINSKAQQYLQQLEQIMLQEIEPMLEAIEAGEELSDETELWVESGDRLIIEVEQGEDLSASFPLFSEPLYPLDWQELFDEPVCENIVDEPRIEYQSLTFAKLAAQELRIILERETIARKKGEAIAISGQIEVVKPTPSSHLESVILDKLLYELRNPQTGEICIALVQAIGQTSLPHTFEGYLEVPEQWEVALLIGTVILETGAGLTAIRQPFLITTDLKEEILPETQHPHQYAISNHENELSRTINYLLAQEAKSPPLNLDLPEPNKMNRKLQHAQSISEPPILPPKLTQATEREQRSLELPALPKPQKNTSVTEISSPIPESKTAHSPNEVNKEIINPPHTSVEEAFEALPLKERFLVRLNSLAESEKSTQTPS